MGDECDMWLKIMKEVKAKRYVRPYDKIPFTNYIQSPIRLVPKVGGKTRLIFHLSFEFSGQEDGKSVNGCIPKEKCSVRYNDLDKAIANCLLMSKKAECLINQKMVFLGKTDLSSVFRVLPLKIKCLC